MTAMRSSESRRAGGYARSARALAAILCAGVFLVCGVGAARSVGAAAAQKTALDGVYTNDQAARGKAQYNTSCSACHMEDLSGSGQALPLAGDAFTDVWEGHPVSDLFDLIQGTMPQDKPGSLTPDQAVDIITYILKSNQFPAGKDELKSDPEMLKNIIITKKAAPKS
jgi:S-disulfanyl-L-cysteine oxidoreductase SoxD